jgi:hypothetical protein
VPRPPRPAEACRTQRSTDVNNWPKDWGRSNAR